MKRGMYGAALTVVLGLLGTGAAEAYSFGPTTVSSDGVDRGAGKGSFYGVGWDGARLEPTLRDFRVDDMQAYIEGNTNNRAKVQSGRRGDGKSSWVTLSTRTAYAGSSTANVWSTVDVCMDRAWATDPCRRSKSGNF